MVDTMDFNFFFGKFLEKSSQYIHKNRLLYNGVGLCGRELIVLDFFSWLEEVGGEREEQRWLPTAFLASWLFLFLYFLWSLHKCLCLLVKVQTIHVVIDVNDITMRRGHGVWIVTPDL